MSNANRAHPRYWGRPTITVRCVGQSTEEKLLFSVTLHSILWILQHYWHKTCRFSTYQPILQHQPGALQLNSIPTPSPWRQCHTSQVKSSVPQDGYFRCQSQVYVVNLCSWPMHSALYIGSSTTPSSGSINLLEGTIWAKAWNVKKEPDKSSPRLEHSV